MTKALIAVLLVLVVPTLVKMLVPVMLLVMCMPLARPMLDGHPEVQATMDTCIRLAKQGVLTVLRVVTAGTATTDGADADARPDAADI